MQIAKYSYIATALTLLITLVIIPISKANKLKDIINKDKLKDNFTLSKAKYYMNSDKGDNLELSAANVEQQFSEEFLLTDAEAIIKLHNHTQFIISTNKILWLKKQNFLNFPESMKLESDEYNLESSNVNFDIKKKLLYGNEKINIQSDFGSLYAYGFNLNANENYIKFTGPIKFVINKK